jgi:hypothetical protein
MMSHEANPHSFAEDVAHEFEVRRTFPGLVAPIPNVAQVAERQARQEFKLALRLRRLDARIVAEGASRLRD